MTSPVVFLELPSGRTLAKWGERTVGVVAPYPFGGKAKAYWLCTLPKDDGTMPAPMPKPASSLTKARRALLFEIEQWFSGGGDAGREVARALRLHADEVAV